MAPLSLLKQELAIPLTRERKEKKQSLSYLLENSQIITTHYTRTWYSRKKIIECLKWGTGHRRNIASHHHTGSKDGDDKMGGYTASSQRFVFVRHTAQRSLCQNMNNETDLVF